MKNKTLPRGIWYEADKKRFRVRKYKNRTVYLQGYYRTFAEAVAALAVLEAYLATVPTKRKNRKASST